tara:strand:+ start:3757 stop:4521 length:765 start_codon:yes stop_codon:yes gene_type:complete
MKNIFLIFFIICIVNKGFTRDFGETFITADDGIEVYQDEKFYLLKKNVNIESDTFTLKGDLVKIYFEKDLYDIIQIDASGNVVFQSTIYSLNGKSNTLIFKVLSEEIFLKGSNSNLIIRDIIMNSDNEIIVNNINGNFFINGENSSLKTIDLLILGQEIEGSFTNQAEINEISELDVYDDNVAYIKSDETEMYANIVRYNKITSLIELENNVKIIRNDEVISGDYGTLDTKNNSYKIKSKESNKVKIIINTENE